MKYPKRASGEQSTGNRAREQSTGAGNGKRETESVEWEQRTLNGEQGTMSWERETAKRKREREKLNGEQKTSNREPRTEVWRRVFSGNPLTIQNGGQRKRKVNKCYSCKLEFLPDVPPDGKYLLVRAESH